MEKILSIIVPAYNVEKYIEKCLDSFTGLKAPEEIEVIIVNDGSKGTRTPAGWPAQN